MKFMMNNFSKILFVFVLLGCGFLFAKEAEAASQIYYVDSTKLVDTGDGLTPATACKAINTCITKGNSVSPTGTGSGQGHIYKISGTFSEYVAITDVDQAGATITGCTDNTFTNCTSSARDLVINQGDGTNHGLYATTNSLTLENFTQWSPPTGVDKQAVFVTGSGIQISNMRIVNKGVHTSGVLRLSGADNFSVLRNIIEGGNDGRAVYATGDAGGTFAYNLILPGNSFSTWRNGIGFNHNATGAVNIFNNTCVGSTRNNCIYISDMANATIKNNIVYGPLEKSDEYAIQCIAGATCAEDNNIILGNIWQANRYYVGMDSTGANTILDTTPSLYSPAKVGYIILRVDDEMSDTKYAYLSGMATLMKPYGFHGTSYFYNNSLLSVSQYAHMRALLNDADIGGIWEIGSHSESHAVAGATTGGTLSCTGCGTNPMYKIDLTNHQFSVKTDSGTENYTYTLNAGNSDNFSTIILDIRAHTANKWNISYSVGSSSYLKASSLTAVDWTTTATAITIDRSDNTCDGGNCTGFFKDEVYTPIATIENIVNGDGNITDPQTETTFHVRSYAYPNNEANANYAVALKSAGFSTVQDFNSGSVQDLSSFDSQYIPYMWVTSLIGSTAADTARKVRWLGTLASEYGLVISIGAHSEAEASTVNQNGWPTILATLAEFGNSIRVVSAQELYDTIIQTPWTWAPDGTYPLTSGVATRIYGTSATGDYHLQSTSPAINAGTNVGLTSDIVGTVVPQGGGYDIGAYEYTQSTAPTVSVTAPSASAVVSGNSVTVTATASATSPATVSSVQFKLDGVNLDSADTESPYSIIWDTAAASNGSHELTAVVTDSYGNSATSDIVTVTVDNAGPTGTISNGNGSPTNDTTPTLNLTIADAGIGITGAQMQFSCDNVTYSSWESYATPKTNFNVRTGAGCTDADGSKTVYVKYKDSLDNIGSSYNTGAFTLDTASSNAALSNTPASLTNSTSASITVAGTDVVSYKYKLDSGSYGIETVIATAITLSSLVDGSHTLSVIGKDSAGNWQAEGSATTYTWTVDTAVPIRSAGSPSSSQTAGTTQVTLSLATNESSTCKYSTTAGTAYGSMTSDFTTSDGLAHTATVSTSNGQSYNYYIRCQDLASNANTDDYLISLSVASPSGGGGSPAMWTLPIVPTNGFKMNINGGASTTSNRSVILGFNAGVDIKKMAVSMTGDFTDASQENYVAFKQWDLCSKFGGAVKNPTCPDGKYTVYAQFYTAYGRSTSDAIASSTITLKSGSTTAENLQPVINLPAIGSFTKYLQFKQTNADVKRLQIFLNSDPDTKIANTGAGSSGKETNYFGLLTFKAVIKFQEKYAKDVLSPWGFKKGTGYVGKTTLLKINELIGNK
jgi:hypothetical protein